MTVGERIKQKRMLLKLSQKAIAEKAGVTVMAISNLERGITRSPSAENLLPLAKALNVDPNWLITGEGSSAPENIEPPEPQIPWPQSPDQINMSMIADLASRVVKATGADSKMINSIILETITEHYIKSDPITQRIDELISERLPDGLPAEERQALIDQAKEELANDIQASPLQAIKKKA